MEYSDLRKQYLEMILYEFYSMQIPNILIPKEMW